MQRSPAPPEFDELYHYLAAEGWCDTGSLSILAGSNTRVSGYTLAVARFLDLIGQDSLAVARIVSLVPGLAFAGRAFLVDAGPCGGLAAGISSQLVVLWPQGILESQLVRFYSLHVLVFFVGAVAVYAAATGQGRALGLGGCCGGVADRSGTRAGHDGCRLRRHCAMPVG